MRVFNFLLLISFLYLSSSCFAQETSLFKKLEPYFQAPDSLKVDFGSFRSPLVFNNGRIVSSIKEWGFRKKEIKADWEKYLGKWPAFDKKQNFIYLDSLDWGSYIQYTVQFKWTPNECTKGYLLIPKNKGVKNPAIVSVFYDAETSLGIGSTSRPYRPWRDFGVQLVKRGFVTLSIGTKDASEREEYSLYYPSIDNVNIQPLSMLAYAANSAYYVLKNRNDVDSARIGIVGHSFGGKWAMFASCLTDNYAAAVWSDPGVVMQNDRESVNYWEPWYLGFHPKPWRKRGLITTENPAHGIYNKLMDDNRNLHELHVLMAPRPFLVSGGSEDPIMQWKALNHSVAVNKLLGYSNRVAMTNRVDHALNQESTEIIYDFFEFFLK